MSKCLKHCKSYRSLHHLIGNIKSNFLFLIRSKNKDQSYLGKVTVLHDRKYKYQVHSLEKTSLIIQCEVRTSRISPLRTFVYLTTKPVLRDTPAICTDNLKSLVDEVRMN